MNIVSACCHKPIIHGTKKWYPLGGFFHITEKIDACEGCGKEVEDCVLACGNCGEIGCEEVSCP